MNASGMLGSRPSARMAASFAFASPRTRNASISRSGNAVLAIWPVHRTLDFAENLARNGSLCVIPGATDDARAWIARTGAENLWGA